jgi:hypothetical protein
MPHYRFHLHDGYGGFDDNQGVDLPGRGYALAYARDVVTEMMRGREAETRSWCLNVYENQDERVFEILFASLDHTIDHLGPDLRMLVERASDRQRLLSEALYEINQTVRETRALVARARNKPYVATEGGVKVIRDD